MEHISELLTVYNHIHSLEKYDIYNVSGANGMTVAYYATTTAIWKIVHDCTHYSIELEYDSQIRNTKFFFQ